MTTATARPQLSDLQLDEFYLDLQEDGRQISILSSNEISRMPFPGLRPFKTSEFQLFKGRDDQTEELVKRLKQNRFLAVIGSSGTGKSSLVRAGLIPQLFGGYLYSGSNRWNIAICRPGKNPVANLAVALSSVKGESKNRTLFAENFSEIEPMLNSSLYGLLDVNAALNEGKTKEEEANLLVVVDQFEELFRYDRKDLGKPNIESQFVNLLLKAAANKKSAVYVIITMRSEFLGDSVKYRGLPEAINEGQYLVPGLNRTQLKEVIEGPIHLAGKEISPDLVEFLINEIDENKLKENLDQLPILQHALMRTYQEASRQGAKEVVYDHYERIGKMESALAIHAKEKFDELKGNGIETELSKKQQVAKIIFQALTDASTDLKGGRRPTELRNIYAIADAFNASRADVNEVIDHFRDTETSFIMPPINTALYNELIIDISHESLMRNWDLLKKWAEEEARYGKLYQRLNERRTEGQFIQGALLTELIGWREKCPHNAAWASRYYSPKWEGLPQTDSEIYAANLAFLKQSEDEIQLEQKRKEAAKNTKIRLFALAALIFLGFGAWALRERGHALVAQTNAEEAKWDAENLSRVLNVQKKEADSLKMVAEEQRDIAQKSKDSLELVLKENTSIRAQNELARLEADWEAEQKARFQTMLTKMEKRVAINYLRNQPFYQNEMLSDKTKDSIFDFLLKTKITDTGSVDFSNYIQTDILQDVNDAVEARLQFADDPVGGLREAKDIWEWSKMNSREPNRFVHDILMDIFKSNVFYKQKLEPYLYETEMYSDPPSLLAVKDSTRFAFLGTNRVVSGRYEKKNVGLDGIWWLNADRNTAVDTLSSDSVTIGDVSAVKSLTITNQNSILVLKKDGTITRKSGNEVKVLDILPEMNHVWLSEFSPNGKYLATLADDNVLNLWALDSIRNGAPKIPYALSQDATNNNIVKLVFSPDEQKLLVSRSDNNRFDVWDLNSRSRMVRFTRSLQGAANFAANGNLLLVATSSNRVNLIDTSGRSKGTVYLYSLPNQASSGRITELNLSPDWRTLLVSKETGAYKEKKLLLYRTEKSDSLFTQSRVATRNVKPKMLFSSIEEPVSSKFLDSTAVLSLSSGGSVYLWDTKADYPSLESAFDAVRSITDSTYEERYRKDPLILRTTYAGTEKEKLREAADYHFGASVSERTPEKRKEQRDIAIKLYKRLLALDTDYVKAVDSIRIATLAKQNNVLYSAYGSDVVAQTSTEKEDTIATTSQLQEAVRQGENVLRSQKSVDDNFKYQLSNDYWDLSWYLLFNKDKKYDSAIHAAKRSLELYPQNTGVNTNLALGYLLKGDTANAEKIYKQYKDTTFSNTSEVGRKFKEAFQEDFRDMLKFGVIKKDTPAYEEMKRIKKDILGIKEEE
jgi:energy-coupling factor transporter ATP-binding protein EcfA2